MNAKELKIKSIKDSSFRILTESTIHGIPNILKSKKIYSKITWV